MLRNAVSHWSAAALAVALLLGVGCGESTADMVDFRVDPTTIDQNMDGFITGSEFQPVGSDGTVFDLLPTNNLVGADRFLLSLSTGLHFGGGGGSTLSFDFTPSNSITLESYTTPSSGFILGNPTFDIRQGISVLSATNDADTNGTTFLFNGGPVSLTAGTTYTFQVTNSGAGIQSFMESWTYSRSAIPEPSTLAVMGLCGLAMTVRRRR